MTATATTLQPGSVSATRAGILWTLGAMFCFAAMDGISKVLASSLSIPQILWVRYLLFTLLAVAVLRRKGGAFAVLTGVYLLAGLLILASRQPQAMEVVERIVAVGTPLALADGAPAIAGTAEAPVPNG